MASNSVFQPVVEHGWRVGFANLIRKENRDWWGTLSWLRQAIIWTVILIGILAAVLLSPTENEAALLLAGGRAVMGLTVFFAVGGSALPIGTLIMGQGEMLDEKRLGTAAWILSKPVSRIAFILAKLVANAIGILLILVLLEGALAYGLIAAVTGRAFPLLPYLGALAVLYLNAMFYFTLALMLSAATNSRGAAIGIPLAALFGYQFIASIAPWTMEIMPWGLVNAGSGNLGNSVATAIALGRSFSATPIIATLVWCVLFVVFAIWKFNRDEF